MANSKPGVMIYFETGKAIKRLNYEKKGRLFEAIMEYAEHGIVPEFTESDDVLDAVWPFVADKIDRDSARYEEIRQTRAEAGRKGGLARASKAKQDEGNEAFACYDKQIKPTAAETVAEAETSATSEPTKTETKNNGLLTNRPTGTGQPSQSKQDKLEAEKKRQLQKLFG